MRKNQNIQTSPPIQIIASEKSWIEGEAVAQLKKMSQLPGVERVIAMPDLHPGKGIPIGVVFMIKNRIYPYLVGNDIGCGMGLWKTDLKSNKIKLDRWGKKLSDLEGPWKEKSGEISSQTHVAPTEWDKSLGTIGGGNHFAELQQIEQIEDNEKFRDLGLDKNRLILLIHSGSRGFGESILRSHVDQFKAGGLDSNSSQAQEYLGKHDHAIQWARLNRTLIAQRFLNSLGSEGERILDVCHNSVTSKELHGGKSWLHRKGAAPSDQGAIIIAGSRGTFSYLVEPLGEQEWNGYSLAHGAGRKWKRGESRQRLSSRFTPDSLLQTDLGGRVICENKELLYDEAPQAYKNVERVVKDLQEAGLISVIARLRPIITYKVRKALR